MKHTFFLISLIFSLKLSFISSLTYDVSKLKLSKTTDQIMLVIPSSPISTSAKFLFYVKKGNVWKEYINCEAYIGRDGLGLEREDQMKTPIGAFKFTKYFGIADNPGTKPPYIKINEYHYWISDPKSKKYNQLVDSRKYKEFDKKAGEHLINYKKAYKYAMNINYNENGVPNKGLAIFLHCYTEKPYTGGCVAIPEKKMKKVLQKVNKKCRIVIDFLINISKY